MQDMVRGKVPAQCWSGHWQRKMIWINLTDITVDWIGLYAFKFFFVHFNVSLENDGASLSLFCFWCYQPDFQHVLLVFFWSSIHGFWHWYRILTYVYLYDFRWIEVWLFFLLSWLLERLSYRSQCHFPIFCLFLVWSGLLVLIPTTFRAKVVFLGTCMIFPFPMFQRYLNSPVCFISLFDGFYRALDTRPTRVVT